MAVQGDQEGRRRGGVERAGRERESPPDGSSPPFPHGASTDPTVSILIGPRQALHHRSDAFTSFVALLSILGSYFGMPILDPLGGIFVSLLLLTQSSKLAWSSSLSLLDATCPEHTLADARRCVEDFRLESESGARSEGAAAPWAMKSVRGISVGGGARMEVEIAWARASAVGLSQAEKVGREVKERLEKEEGVKEVSRLSPLWFRPIVRVRADSSVCL